MGPTLQEDFWRIADALQKRVSIVDYQIKSASHDRKEGTGHVVLFVRYYAKGNPELITRTINERWVFSDKDKMWRLASHDLNTLNN